MTLGSCVERQREENRRTKQNRTEQNRKEQGYERSPPRLEEGGLNESSKRNDEVYLHWHT
jgi:hypothetical protein